MHTLNYIYKDQTLHSIQSVEMPTVERYLSFDGKQYESIRVRSTGSLTDSVTDVRVTDAWPTVALDGSTRSPFYDRQDYNPLGF